MQQHIHTHSQPQTLTANQQEQQQCHSYVIVKQQGVNSFAKKTIYKKEIKL